MVHDSGSFRFDANVNFHAVITVDVEPPIAFEEDNRDIRSRGDLFDGGVEFGGGICDLDGDRLATAEGVGRIGDAALRRLLACGPGGRWAVRTSSRPSK